MTQNWVERPDSPEGLKSYLQKQWVFCESVNIKEMCCKDGLMNRSEKMTQFPTEYCNLICVFAEQLITQAVLMDDCSGAGPTLFNRQKQGAAQGLMKEERYH